MYRISYRAHLGDDCQFLPEVMEPNGSNIYSIDDDLATCSLQDSEEGICQGGLTSSCPANHTNL